MLPPPIPPSLVPVVSRWNSTPGSRTVRPTPSSQRRVCLAHFFLRRTASEIPPSSKLAGRRRVGNRRSRAVNRRRVAAVLSDGAPSSPATAPRLRGVRHRRVAFATSSQPAPASRRVLAGRGTASAPWVTGSRADGIVRVPKAGPTAEAGGKAATPSCPTTATSSSWTYRGGSLLPTSGADPSACRPRG